MLDTARLSLNRRNWVFFLVTVIGTVVDQVSKWWIIKNIPLHGEQKVIDGWFSLTHQQNPGAAFSMLAGNEYRHIVFGGFTIVCFFIVADVLRRLPSRDWYQSAAIGLILSGALGNAMDRVRLRVVTDFLLVYTEQPALKAFCENWFNTSRYPSFNIADAALLIGIVMLGLHYLFVEEGTKSWTGDVKGEAPAS